MRINFHDNGLHLRFAPLTLTRPVADLRFGILTIAESWLQLLQKDIHGFVTESYLSVKYPALPESDDLVTIAGNIKPTRELARWVAELQPGQRLEVNQTWIATRGTASTTVSKTTIQLLLIQHVWDLFQLNGKAIETDFELITQGRNSLPLDSSNRRSESGSIFIEEGAKVSFSILNASEGPIYIGKDAEVMDGSIIRGPFALGTHAAVKMGAKIYGPTTVGPHCKVGGEISNSIFQAYSNKGHDGFLGNSLVGEWCNFGADTNSSNLMNTYAPVKIHSYETGKAEQTQITFCGVIMGDHSKTGINTMLNTATVVGVSANIFGAGFPSKYIPSFTWGAAGSEEKFRLDKAFEVASAMMKRRHLNLDETDRKILTYLHGMAR